jgi:hypothetical protein
MIVAKSNIEAALIGLAFGFAAIFFALWVTR